MTSALHLYPVIWAACSFCKILTLDEYMSSKLQGPTKRRQVQVFMGRERRELSVPAASLGLPHLYADLAGRARSGQASAATEAQLRVRATSARRGRSCIPRERYAGGGNPCKPPSRFLLLYKWHRAGPPAHGSSRTSRPRPNALCG